MNNLDAYIGFDCGNSSVRTVLGTFDGSRITTEVIHQVPNQGLRGATYDYWDILAIFHEMQKGMKLGLDTIGKLSSFGVSTWGIDFGFLGQSGELLANPLCYRNPLGAAGMASRSQTELDFLFHASGIQKLPMNSMYQ